MESNILEAEINLNEEKSLTQIAEKQKTFLETDLGKIINEGLDIGIKAILPDLIEEEVIEIKDALFTEGFSGAIKTAIDEAMDLGKSFLGIFTGKFENISQVKNAVKSGGLIDKLSDVVDGSIKLANQKNLINDNISKVLKNGKNLILNTISEKIENNLTSQVESVEKIDTYIKNWKQFFENQDFEGMDKQFNKIEKEIQKIIPIENTILQAKTVENLHNLIKNNGKNFNLSEQELELAKKLI